jgi:hypothetical protein
MTRDSALLERARHRAAPPVSARPSAAEQLRGPAEPWAPRDITRVLAVSAAGALIIGIAWFGSGGTTSLSRQLLWTVVGIGGVTVAAVTQGTFVLAAFREIKARRLAVMNDAAALVRPFDTEVPTVLEHSADTDDRVAAAVMTHFHRPSCLLVTGKDVPLHGTAEDHVAAGRTPCGVCAA